MSFEIQIPSILIVGGGGFERVPEVLTRLHCARPLIVTDPFLAGTGLSTCLRESNANSGLECGIFSERSPTQPPKRSKRDFVLSYMASMTA